MTVHPHPVMESFYNEMVNPVCSFLVDPVYSFLTAVVYLAGVYEHVYANINNCVISLTTRPVTIPGSELDPDHDCL